MTSKMDGPVNDSQILVQNRGLKSTKHVDGVTVLNPVSGNYYALSETAAFIWERLQAPMRISVVKDELAAKYGVSLREVGGQIDACIAAMVAEELVEITSLLEKVG